MIRNFLADFARLDFAHRVEEALHLLIKLVVVFMAGLENLDLSRVTSAVRGAVK